MTTGDDILLLAIDPDKRRLREIGRLRFVLRAAELADLGMAGRIAIGVRRIDVLDAARVEDRHLSGVLQALDTAAPPPHLTEWLRQTPRSLATQYLYRLEDQKAVRVRRSRDRTGHTRHDVLSLDLPRRQAVLARLDAVVRAGRSAPDPAEADLALAALVQAAGLASAAYPGLRGVAARRRLAALAAGDRLAPEAAGAATVDHKELAATIADGAGFTGRRLYAELSQLYSDFTTGGSGLGHDLSSGSWSDGGGHHGGSGGGHHGGGHDSGGGHGGW